MTEAPIILTERLRLRPHKISDFDTFWTFYQTDRATYVDGGHKKSHLWYSFVSETGSWPLTGWGGWAIDTKDGRFVGQVSIMQPPHFAELEIGWILFDGFEGQGIAYEAASAALDYAFAQRGLSTLVSYIDAENARSIALAKRLGATQDPEAHRHDDRDVVYRHSPEAWT